MSSYFDDRFSDGPAQRIVEVDGESITYQVAGSETTDTFDATIDRKEFGVMNFDDGRSEVRMATVSVEPSDVSDPGVGDKIGFDGGFWFVSKVGDGNEKGLIPLIVKRTESVRVGHRGQTIER